MSSKDYKKIILEELLKKYYNRSAKNITTNRRIIVKPTELYKEYAKNIADIAEKREIHEAAAALYNLGFVTVAYLKFSDDIEKIYLSETQINAVQDYLKDEYNVVPWSAISKQVHEILTAYIGTGELVQSYCENILARLDDPREKLVPEKIENDLKMVRFLENNEEHLYVREASVLVYGDSKWFENNNYDAICTFMRTSIGKVQEDGEKNDAVLEHFHVVPTEQELMIKGSWIVEWDHYILDTSNIPGGIAIVSGDVRSIKNIRVNTDCVMTIENKTSFQRLKDKRIAMMYLGGFANRHQIEFLKKVISDNPNTKYYHFGDIDIGGFLIHKHLCRETAKPFALYGMGMEQLCDARFRHCLSSLTDNDRSKLTALKEEAPYREVLEYMQEHNVKLEQEIVSYYMEKDVL